MSASLVTLLDAFNIIPVITNCCPDLGSFKLYTVVATNDTLDDVSNCPDDVIKAP